MDAKHVSEFLLRVRVMELIALLGESTQKLLDMAA
jgi:hypothetical protein